MESNLSNTNFSDLTRNIKTWGKELGFDEIGISDTDLSAEENHLQQWLHDGRHGDMDYMARHGTKRARPHELVPGTVRVISVRMDYLPGDTQQIKVLKDPTKAYISRYALGRDYHKLIRKRLAQLAERIDAALPPDYPLKGQNRAFVDSAPVMERPFAEKAGLGWQGKHTLIINSDAGSWFFLGEILLSLDLQSESVAPPPDRCGTCA